MYSYAMRGKVLFYHRTKKILPIYLHNYIKSLKTPVYTGLFAFFELHNNYIKLHNNYI
jgi:hypothetical protein